MLFSLLGRGNLHIIASIKSLHIRIRVGGAKEKRALKRNLIFTAKVGSRIDLMKEMPSACRDGDTFGIVMMAHGISPSGHMRPEVHAAPGDQKAHGAFDQVNGPAFLLMKEQRF